MMQRRDFLRLGSMATVGGLTVRGFGNPLLAPLLNKSIADDRVLVIVQLYGGNDGLNTVIPLDQYSVLNTLRSNVLIPDTAVLPLAGTGGTTGLHPAMGGMMDLWDDGKLAIVQGVGYPDPDFSHFRSTDIWETGADSNEILTSGWTGRYLNMEYPNYPVGYPNATMPDPLAIRIGAPITIGLQHMGVSMGASIYTTDDPLDLSGNIYNDAITADCKGDKLDFVRTVQQQADQYGNVIQAAADPLCNMSSMYPTGTQPGARLAQALKIVAQLICGGLKTRIYWVSEMGFDTHAQQVQLGDTTLGTHANLLQGVSDSIRAFQDDVQLLGIADRVLGMTFSEFGRRIVSNGSRGTDHGTSAPMFLFGNKVQPGMTGSNPVIDPGTTYADNLPMQYDFRSVYASVLKDWFCLNDTDTDLVLLDTYMPLALVDPAGCLSIDVHEANQAAGTSLLDVYPNPLVERAQVKFTSMGGKVLLQVFSGSGQLVATVHNGPLPAGTHRMDLDLGHLPDGVYYCRLQNGAVQQVKNVVKVRG